MLLALIGLAIQGCRQGKPQQPVDSEIRQILEKDTPNLVVAVASLNCGGCDEILRCLIAKKQLFRSARYFVAKTHYKKFVAQMPPMPEGHVLAFPGDLMGAPYNVQNIAILKWQQGQLICLPMHDWSKIVPMDSLKACIYSR